MSSETHPSEFYYMGDIYDYMVEKIAFLEKELSLDECYLSMTKANGCECYKYAGTIRFGTEEDEVDREEFDQHVKVCNEPQIEAIESTKSYIQELKELCKIMSDNGERRKLALLALVMKRRK